MDWAWWGTVVLTVVLMIVALVVLFSGLFASSDDSDHPRAIAARSGGWLALSAVCLMPSGLFFFFYAWDRGGHAEFAARFPRTDAYWQEFIPRSFDPAVRDLFSGYYATSFTVLTVIAGLAALVGLYRLYWQPVRQLARYAREYDIPLTSGVFVKHLVKLVTLATLYTAATVLFLKLMLQTLLYVLAHAVATTFYILPFLVGFLLLALFGGAGGKDIYDRYGNRIGRLD